LTVAELENVENSVCVAFEGFNAFTSFKVPDLDGTVLSTRSELTVGKLGKAPNTPGVAGESFNAGVLFLINGVKAPDLNGFVVRARSEVTVSKLDKAKNSAFVAGEGVNALAGFRVPDPNGFVP
jgi:hypothetical protein